MTYELPPCPIELIAGRNRAMAAWDNACDARMTPANDERRQRAHQALGAADRELESGWHQYPYRADTCRRCSCRGFRAWEYGWIAPFRLDSPPEEPAGLVPLMRWYPRWGGAYPVCLPCRKALHRQHMGADPGDDTGDLPEYQVAARQLDLFR